MRISFYLCISLCCGQCWTLKECLGQEGTDFKLLCSMTDVKGAWVALWTKTDPTVAHARAISICSRQTAECTYNDHKFKSALHHTSSRSYTREVLIRKVTADLRGHVFECSRWDSADIRHIAQLQCRLYHLPVRPLCQAPLTDTFILLVYQTVLCHVLKQPVALDSFNCQSQLIPSSHARIPDPRVPTRHFFGTCSARIQAKLPGLYKFRIMLTVSLPAVSGVTDYTRIVRLQPDPAGQKRAARMTDRKTPRRNEAERQHISYEKVTGVNTSRTSNSKQKRTREIESVKRNFKIAGTIFTSNSRREEELRQNVQTLQKDGDTFHGKLRLLQRREALMSKLQTLRVKTFSEIPSSQRGNSFSRYLRMKRGSGLRPKIANNSGSINVRGQMNTFSIMVIVLYAVVGGILLAVVVLVLHACMQHLTRKHTRSKEPVNSTIFNSHLYDSITSLTAPNYQIWRRDSCPSDAELPARSRGPHSFNEYFFKIGERKEEDDFTSRRWQHDNAAQSQTRCQAENGGYIIPTLPVYYERLPTILTKKQHKIRRSRVRKITRCQSIVFQDRRDLDVTEEKPGQWLSQGKFRPRSQSLTSTARVTYEAESQNCP